MMAAAFFAGSALAADTYKVGAIFSVTGPASFLGDPEKKTAEMVAEKINASGGINGKKLELVIYDDEGDASKATSHFRKLVQTDNVVAVIGPSVSGNSIALNPIAEEVEMPIISAAASWKITTKNRDSGEQFKWVFKTPQSDSLAVEAIYSHMQKKGIKKIALLSVNSGFGASGREELLRLAPAFGMEIAADEKYEGKDTDMSAQLTKIKGLGVQAIVNWSIGPTQVVVLRNWKDLGMNSIPFYQSHGFGSKKNIEQAAGAAEGVYCPLGAVNIASILPDSHPQKKVTMAYTADYAAKYKEPVSSFGGHAYDALTLVADALGAVGDDKAKIRDYLENKKGFVGQHGVFNFSAKDHNGLTKDAFNMVVVKGNDWALAD